MAQLSNAPDVWGAWYEEGGYAELANNINNNHVNNNNQVYNMPHHHQVMNPPMINLGPPSQLALSSMSSPPQHMNMLPTYYQPHLPLPSMIPHSPAPDDFHVSSSLSVYGQPMNQSLHDPSFLSPRRPSPPYSSPAMLGTQNFSFHSQSPAAPLQFQANQISLPSSPSTNIMLASGTTAQRFKTPYVKHLSSSSPGFSPGSNTYNNNNNAYRYQPTPDRPTMSSPFYTNSHITPHKSPFSASTSYAGVPHENLTKMLNAGSSPAGPSNTVHQFLHQHLHDLSPYNNNTYRQTATPLRDVFDDTDLSVTLSSYPSLSTSQTEDSPLPSIHNGSPSNMSLQQSTIGSSSLNNSAQLTHANQNTAKRHFSMTTSPSVKQEQVEAKPVVKKTKIQRTSSLASVTSASDTLATGRSSPTSETAPKVITKGLRHFSMRVCQKVQEVGETTYNDVADELVAELKEQNAVECPPVEDEEPDKKTKKGKSTAKRSYDEKNVRRRVYDALNVLMAMGIIEKDKKRICWIGLPGGVARQCSELQKKKDEIDARAAAKRTHLTELLMYLVALYNLADRNEATMASIRNGTAPPDAEYPTLRNSVPLRFLLIKTDPSHIVHLSVSPDQSELQCEVSGEFMLHSGEEILQMMGLAEVDAWQLPSIIPREMISFYPQHLIRARPAPTPVSDTSFSGKFESGSFIVGGQQ